MVVRTSWRTTWYGLTVAALLLPTAATGFETWRVGSPGALIAGAGGPTVPAGTPAVGWSVPVERGVACFTAVAMERGDAHGNAGDRGWHLLGETPVVPWVGTGVRWRPSEALVLSVEGRWDPSGFDPGGPAVSAGAVEAGVTAVVRWP